MTGGDRVIRWGLYVSLAVVTMIAVAISYGHLYDLAKEHGETGPAAAAGPVTVDGLILACSLVIVNAARQRSRPPFLAWLLLLAGIGATLSGNVAHGIEHGWAGSMVAGWPAVVAAGCFHLVIGEIRRGRVAPTEQGGDEWEWWPLPDLGSAGETADGYALWDLVEPDPEPVATGDPDLLPAITTAPPQVLEIEGDEPSDPELEPVVATARDRFAEVLATGDLPSVRAIRKELRLGHPRAKQVHSALSSKIKEGASA